MSRAWIMGLALGGLGVSAAHAASFDARRPADVAHELTTHSVVGRMATGDGETYFAGKSGRFDFKIRFKDCNEAGTRCQTLLFEGDWTPSTAVSTDQMNLWNNWATYCPGFVDGDSHPQVWSFMAVSARTAPADVLANEQKWTGCLTDFGRFVAGPAAYLKGLTGG
jgi:hypothetical protein